MKTNTSLEYVSDRVKSIADDLRASTTVHLIYTSQMLNTYLDKRARENGHNRCQLDIMHTLIVHNGILKPSEISRLTLRSKQTVTKIVDGLEKAGLVKREQIGKDRRARHVSITEKGILSVIQSLPTTKRVLSQAIDKLEEQQMKDLKVLLRMVRESIKRDI